VITRSRHRRISLRRDYQGGSATKL